MFALPFFCTSTPCFSNTKQYCTLLMRCLLPIYMSIYPSTWGTKETQCTWTSSTGDGQSAMRKYKFAWWSDSLATCACIHLCMDTEKLCRWWYQLRQRKAWSRYTSHTILPSCNPALNIAAILLKLNPKRSLCRNSSPHNTFFWTWREEA